MKAPIKRDRYIVIGIQIDGKKISTLCKVSFNQHSLKSLENLKNKLMVEILFSKGSRMSTLFFYIGAT